jgi:hypothetical protein
MLPRVAGEARYGEADTVRVLRAIAILLLVLVLFVAATAFGARYADGPIAVFPGGPFKTGEWVEDPAADLSFAADIEEIEMESGAPPSSRTVWILVLDGNAYVPCSLSFPPLKRWHFDALEFPAAVVRIDGRRYRKRLEKVQDPALHARLLQVAQAKYADGPVDVGAEGDVWFFLLAPATGSR